MAKKKSNLIDSISPNLIQIVVLIIVAVAAFYIGKLTTQVQYFENQAQLGDSPPTGERPTQPPSNPGQQPTSLENLQLVTEDDHIRGDPNAKVALIEYSDYDCPFCARFHTTAQQAVDEYSGELMWVYRHFPLEGLHPEAKSKAIASECVAAIGGNDAFWAFTDALFESEVQASELDSVVQQIGLDVNAFNSCLETDQPLEEVNEDMSTASAVGVRGTPGNYVVNLETEEVIPLRGAVPFANIQSAVEQVK